jgi:hypothetical protein
MPVQIGAMSVGDVLDRGLKLFLARLATFYAINMLVLAPLLALQVALPLLELGPFAAPGPTFLASVFAGLVAIIIVQFFLMQLATAGILKVIAEAFVGRRAGIGQALWFALSRFFRLVVVSLVYLLMYGVGLCMCIVPGIVVLVIFAFPLQVVVVENKGPLDALSRSLELTAGYRWRVLGVLCMLFIGYLLVVGVSTSLQLLLPFNEAVMGDMGVMRTILISYPNYVINQVAAFLLLNVWQTYYNICVTLMYFDVRIRKEGYDLELAVQQQAAAAS